MNQEFYFESGMYKYKAIYSKTSNRWDYYNISHGNRRLGRCYNENNIITMDTAKNLFEEWLKIPESIDLGDDVEQQF